MKKHRLDASSPRRAARLATDFVNGDHFTGGYSSASAVAGYPHITVPAGLPSDCLSGSHSLQERGASHR